MAEPEAMKPTADRAAMHRDRVIRRQFHAQFVERQIPLIGQPPADPRAQATQLAGAPRMTLRLRLKSARLASQLDHVVDEFRRNPVMTRRRAMAATLVDKSDNPFAQLYRMWFAHK